MIRFGLALPHYDVSLPDRPTGWEDLVGVARWAEERGFRSVWVSDHYFLDISRYGGPAGARSCYDPLVTLAALSTRTDRVALGTLVLAVGFRPPAVLAKTAATLDRSSGGRLELGLGAGWNRPEYEAAGLPFPSAGIRLEQLGEAAELVRQMTRGDRTTFQGEHFSVREAPNLPPAARRPVPVWIGAKGDRALRVAARHGDGWNVVWRWTIESYRERLREFERACRESGRDPGEVRRSVGLVTLVGEDRADLEARYARWQRLAPGGMLEGISLDEFAADRLVGTPAQVLERVEGFEGLGVGELILNFAPLPFGWYPESGQDLFAEQILPARAVD